jgi:hypothetical protein
MRATAGSLFVGFAFGLALSRAGFTSWDELHAMFVMRDPTLVLTFATAAALMALAWAIVRRVSKPRWASRRIHPGTLPGGLIFGVGWALAGACPSAVFAALGEGQLAALWTLAGIFAGNALYALLQPRFFRWPKTSCVDD